MAAIESLLIFSIKNTTFKFRNILKSICFLVLNKTFCKTNCDKWSCITDNHVVNGNTSVICVILLYCGSCQAFVDLLFNESTIGDCVFCFCWHQT